MEILVIILSAIVLSAIFHIFYEKSQYKKTSYYQITKNPHSSAIYDKGTNGEYLTYRALKHFEKDGGKFLFNLFIPKGNNETTEIDLLLICSKGLFVFECKNYGGWIFGHENQKYWTQTLPNGRRNCRKEQFYNPIMQNAWHIKYLKNLIGHSIPIYSIIVFSNRAAFKNVNVISKNTYVIKHFDLSTMLSKICSEIEGTICTDSQIMNIYKKLYPYSQQSSEIKQQHIKNLRKNFN